MAMNYAETLEFLYQQLPMFQRQGAPALKKDLRNTIELLRLLGHPHLTLPTIHIAGTNGKGSVTHILAAIYQEAGFSVGCYTSPHYKDFRERIKINGEFISEADVVEFVDEMKPEIESVQPSFFELTVAMAFAYFKKKKVDIAIIETGLGGRLDSTNVITPLLSVITNIGWDHMDFLGNSLQEIAGEKAGIIKPKVPALIGERQKEVEKVFVKRTEEQRAPLYYAEDVVEIKEWQQGITATGFEYKVLDEESPSDWNAVTTDLWGTYQEKNMRTALAAVSLLQDKYRVEDQVIVSGLRNIRSKTHFLGRCHIQGESPMVLLDSAHNIDGMRELLQQVDQLPYDKLHIVFGTVSDKDPSKVVSILPENAEYYLCKPNIPRGREADELMGFFKGKSASSYPSVIDAFNAAKANANEDDLVLVCGSIFVVAEALD